MDNEEDKVKVKREKQARVELQQQRLSSPWIKFVKVITCCIPDKILAFVLKNSSARLAWREKIVLNLIILFVSGLFFMLVVGVGLIICPDPLKFVDDLIKVSSLSTLKRPLVSAYGYYYDVHDIIDNHVYTAGYLNLGAFNSTVLGYDVSPMFKKPDFFSSYCPGLEKPPSGWDNIKREIPEPAMTVWVIHEDKNKDGTYKNYLQLMKKDLKGVIAKDKLWISQFLVADPVSHYLIIAYGRVYDVSAYMNTVQVPRFLGPNIKQIINGYGKTGEDATRFFDQVKDLEGPDKLKRYLSCMDEMFFVGKVDMRSSPGCIASNMIVLVTSIFIVVILGFKFIAALQFSTTGSPQSPTRYVICAVPCYNEGSDSLRSTFASVAMCNYSSSHKLLFVVVDGVVRGKDNTLFTSDIVLDILGWRKSGNGPPTRMYHALGEGTLQLNMAKVYSGVWEHSPNVSLPCIVVVKTGQMGNNGNRGKRGTVHVKLDSQLILMKFLSEIHLAKPMNPIELELGFHFNEKIGIDPRNYEFLMWIDGDTEIGEDSLSRLVSAMENDSTISGICGETELRNPSESWVTMIQVYEYWVTHNLAKSFESLFGTVTCLPGCFSMFRVYTASDASLIVASPKLIKEYGRRNIDTLHLKNLLSLGEDRYLTTLILKLFPGMRTRFTSDAKAMTSAPESWSILLSQRRRWINSTVHNLLELVRLKELTGFFIFSIRFVVLMDLISTVLSPAGFLYFVYLFIVLFTEENNGIPLLSIILFVAIYGLQVFLFLIKRQWQHLGWMILYVLAMPLYFLVLPIYAFWNFDDFNWGSTRLVEDDDDEFVLKAEDIFDPKTIPLKTWSKYEVEDLPWRISVEETELDPDF